MERYRMKKPKSEAWIHFGGTTRTTPEHEKLHAWAMRQIKLGAPPERIIQVLRETYPKIERVFA